MLVFEERGKPEYPEKTSRSKDENQQQTQPTYDAESGNRTRHEEPTLACFQERVVLGKFDQNILRKASCTNCAEAVEKNHCIRLSKEFLGSYLKTNTNCIISPSVGPQGLTHLTGKLQLETGSVFQHALSKLKERCQTL